MAAITGQAIAQPKVGGGRTSPPTTVWTRGTDECTNKYLHLTPLALAWRLAANWTKELVEATTEMRARAARYKLMGHQFKPPKWEVASPDEQQE